eukprot:gene45402-55553_t
MPPSPVNRARRIVLAATALAAASAHAAPPAADYELLFADEFDAPRVNERDWNFRLGPRTGTGIDGLNLARNVRVADGHLIVTANHETVDGKPANTGGGLIIGLSTEYFTSKDYQPVRDLVKACKTGPATNIIAGLALGYKSVIVPVFILSFIIYLSFELCDLY